MAGRTEHGHASGESSTTAQIQPSDTDTRWAAWRPLRVPMFRNLVIADLVSDIGTFMQGVGAAWLMVSKGAGPLLVALIQTASALPFFLLALPAGGPRRHLRRAGPIARAKLNSMPLSAMAGNKSSRGTTSGRTARHVGASSASPIERASVKSSSIHGV